MKYKKKLWPLRPATRAGQKAIEIQITNRITDQIVFNVNPSSEVANMTFPLIIDYAISISSYKNKNHPLGGVCLRGGGGWNRTNYQVVMSRLL